MKLRAIQRSPASLGGVWWDFETGDRVAAPNDHLCLLIAEHGNPRHAEAVDALRLLHHTALRAGGDDAKKARDAIAVRSLDDGVLLGWANVEDDDGKPIEYSPERAAEILGDTQNWPLARFVLNASNLSSFYRKEQEEEAKGN